MALKVCRNIKNNVNVDSNGDSWIFGEFDLVEKDTFVFTIDASGEAQLVQMLR